MAFYKQSTAYTRMFKMIDSADHFSKKTGLTCTVNLSKAGAAFGAAGGSVTEVANGWYKVVLNTTDTNTVGDLAFYITATGADDTDFIDQVWVRDLADLAYPATSGRSMVVDAAGLVDANTVKVGPTGSGTAQTARDIGLSVLLASGQKVDVDTIKTNPVVNSGTITFPANATLASTTNITGGTIGTVTTVTNQLTAAQIATGVWQDATAGDFTTASSIGKCLYIANVVPGGTGGHFIAGTNAATSITTALTANIIGNITGNLSGSVGSLTTNNDKTGYSLTQAFPTNFSSLGIGSGGHILNVDTLTTYTGDTPQTGDAYARLGAPTGASVSVDIAAIKTDTTNIRAKFKKNTAHAKFQFPMYDSTTGASKTGLTVAGQVNIDGAGFINLTNAISELANGWYTVDLAAGDLNGTNIALQFTATGAITRDLAITTIA